MTFFQAKAIIIIFVLHSPLCQVSLGEADIIIDGGYTKPLALLKMSDRVQLMRTLMLHYTVLRLRSVLDQLAEGLSTLGVLEAMSSYPKLMEPLFIKGKLKPLTACW